MIVWPVEPPCTVALKPARRTVEDKRTLVIVESPAKAKTIAKYLGDGYEVMASVGHVRDLVAPKEVPAEL